MANARFLARTNEGNAAAQSRRDGGIEPRVSASEPWDSSVHS